MKEKQIGGKNASGIRSEESQLFAEIITKMNALDQEKKYEMKPGYDSSNDGEITIDLREIFYSILPKMYIILIGILVGALLFGFYAFSLHDPEYTATAKIYIAGQTDNSILADNNVLLDLQIGSYLTDDFREVFQTWEVNQMVNEQLGTDFSYKELQKMLKVENPENTRVINISVTNTDPQLAASIANAYAAAAQRFIAKSMSIPEPNIFSSAEVPIDISSRGLISYIILGMLCGLVLTTSILVILITLDNRPKSQEDIIRYANIPVLAVLPIDAGLYNDNLGKRKKSKL